MEHAVIVLGMVVGLTTLLGGAAIAVFALWRAPDGFEDTDGCHLHPHVPRDNSAT